MCQVEQEQVKAMKHVNPSVPCFAIQEVLLPGAEEQQSEAMAGEFHTNIGNMRTVCNGLAHLGALFSLIPTLIGGTEMMETHGFPGMSKALDYRA